MTRLIERQQWDLKQTQSIVGKLHFTHVCYPSMFPYISIFYARTAPAMRDGEKFLWPSAAMRENLSTLRAIVGNNPTTTLSKLQATPHDADATFAVDAAGRDGAGGFGLGDDKWSRAFHMAWPATFSMDEDETSSALQELIAIYVTIATYGQLFGRINIWSDSQPAVKALAKGFAKPPRCNNVIKAILKLAHQLDVVVLVLWHSRAGSPSAIAADALSHASLSQARVRVPALSTTNLTTLSPNDYPIFGTTSTTTSAKRARTRPNNANSTL
jgi:hypothetical protein